MGVADAGRCRRRDPLQRIGIAQQDFIAQRRALAIGDGRLQRRWRGAFVGDGFDVEICKPGAAQIGGNVQRVVIAVRRAGQKARRVVGKAVGGGPGGEIGEDIILDPVPDVEDKSSPGSENAPRLAIALNPVGEEHDPELADHHVEACVIVRQGGGVGLGPADAGVIGLAGAGAFQHRRVEVAHRVMRVRTQARRNGAGDHAAAGCGFQNSRRIAAGHAPGQIVGVAFEYQRHEIVVINLGHSANKDVIVFRHGGIVSPRAMLPEIAASGNADSHLSAGWPGAMIAETPGLG